MALSLRSKIIVKTHFRSSKSNCFFHLNVNGMAWASLVPNYVYFILVDTEKFRARNDNTNERTLLLCLQHDSCCGCYCCLHSVLLFPVVSFDAELKRGFGRREIIFMQIGFLSEFVILFPSPVAIYERSRVSRFRR